MAKKAEPQPKKATTSRALRKTGTKQARGASQIFLTWLPVLTAVLGVVLTASVFLYRDIYLPGTVPINLTTDVRVKEAGFSMAGERLSQELEAIEITISARNPSTRKVYLLKNLWQAFGVTIEALPGDENWLDNASNRVREGYLLAGSRHHQTRTATLVALGSVFRDSVLNPDETVSMTVVIYVPRGVYDFLEVDVFLPTVSEEDPEHPDEGIVRAKYPPNSERSGFNTVIYKLNANGEEEELPKDEQGFYITPPGAGLNAFTSTSQLSLWQSKPPPSAKPPEAPSP